MKYNLYAVLTGILLFIGSCHGNTPSQKIPAIVSYFISEKPEHRVTLSKKLREISGLAMTEDGRLFAHNDEQSTVFQLHPKTGDILKSFTVGKRKDDFEGLAVVGDKFYLVTSEGNIYEFVEGPDGADVPYKLYKTSLSLKNDVEGLCYDPVTNCLLLACKGSAGKGNSKYKAIFAFFLKTKKLDVTPRFLLEKKAIANSLDDSFSRKLGDFFLLTNENEFSPSGIEYHSARDSFFILAARGKAVLEIDREGRFLGLQKLDNKKHLQPEGITFSKEFDLLISDEGGNKKAYLSSYPTDK